MGMGPSSTDALEWAMTAIYQNADCCGVWELSEVFYCYLDGDYLSWSKRDRQSKKSYYRDFAANLYQGRRGSHIFFTRSSQQEVEKEGPPPREVIRFIRSNGFGTVRYAGRNFNTNSENEVSMWVICPNKAALERWYNASERNASLKYPFVAGEKK